MSRPQRFTIDVTEWQDVEPATRGHFVVAIYPTKAAMREAAKVTDFRGIPAERIERTVALYEAMTDVRGWKTRAGSWGTVRLNWEVLDADPTATIAHEMVHAAMGYLRAVRGSADEEEVEERLAWIAGELTRRCIAGVVALQEKRT